MRNKARMEKLKFVQTVGFKNCQWNSKESRRITARLANIREMWLACRDWDIFVKFEHEWVSEHEKLETKCTFQGLSLWNTSRMWHLWSRGENQSTLLDYVIGSEVLVNKHTASKAGYLVTNRSTFFTRQFLWQNLSWDIASNSTFNEWSFGYKAQSFYLSSYHFLTCFQYSACSPSELWDAAVSTEQPLRAGYSPGRP